MSLRPVSTNMVPKFTNAPKIAVIVSQFNEEVTNGLLEGAQALLKENNLPNAELFKAPGAFELPLIARALAKSGKYEGVVALGCVIKGDTAHFEYISGEAARGMMAVQLETGIPASFGILTVYSQKEALVRSAKDESNKGREAMLACLQTIKTLRKI
ncbi:6,7-dimethyl-8-ribityllumazine synthase [Acetobacteraceae bacterium]|nr:6,7-dimethyl-8-ribityllumazine synthase [Acetobacteraceae bacterium]QCE33018.1 6,7-dimethyl-8-ribityllumazine synthase [Acetobacteraceae bacterium]